MKKRLEEETRRSIKNAHQRFLFEVEIMHRNGNFKSSQGKLIVQRVTEIAKGGNNVLDLSKLLLPDNFIDLLVAYLRSKTCKLIAVNLWRTGLEIQAAISIAQATQPDVRSLQFSAHPISLESIRSQAAKSGNVVLSEHNFNHLDAAAIGVLLKRECKQLQKLDLSSNSLTGPKARNFDGISFLFDCLKKSQLQELNLGDANLRSDGLVAFANAIEKFSVLKKLDLSRNRLAHNSAEETCLFGIESLCNVLWRVKTLREISLVGNNLDYRSSIYIAEMLKVNCTLESMALAQNYLGDAGAVDMATALKKNTTLLSLNMSDCQISCDGLSELATVLSKLSNSLRAINITENPDIRSRGYRSLVKGISTNRKITEVCINPTPKYEKYVSKVKEYLVVNVLLSAVQMDSRRLVEFPVLTETQRTNFVDKVERFSEKELRQLHAERIVEMAARIADIKEATGLSTLRHYAAMEQYTPLKRILWCLEVNCCQKQIEKRSKYTKDELDDESIWDYPLI